jgi:hypothetical protein
LNAFSYHNEEESFMGALTDAVSTYARSPEQAVDKLVEQAEYDHGHDNYSGTIATCHGGFEMGKIDQKAFTKAAINRWITKQVDEIEKLDIMVLELPKSYAKGMGRGVRKYVVVYCGSW